MRLRTKKILACLLAAPLLLSACATRPAGDESANPPTSNAVVGANYRAADALLAQLKGKLIDGQPLIIATVVNIDALDQTSTLGRLVSEQVSTRLAQGGLKMLEMKLRNNVYLKRNQGELMLTREIGEVARTHDAQAVVVGSYAETPDSVFVNIKVIQPTSNLVLAGHDFVLQKDSTVRAMVQRN
ncbi:MAG: FlgO family outer membrane protein [Massilia sp.]